LRPYQAHARQRTRERGAKCRRPSSSPASPCCLPPSRLRQPGFAPACPQSLTTRYHLPAATTLANIRTVAGGWLALRFVCTADLAGFDPHDLPQGTPLPGEVHYTSQLTPDHSRHEVAVNLQPLLFWEPAQ
jgi:hypothetical protein